MISVIWAVKIYIRWDSSFRKKNPKNVSASFADKYDIDDRKEECVDLLLSCIRMDKALDLMVYSNLYSIKQLEDHPI